MGDCDYLYVHRFAKVVNEELVAFCPVLQCCMFLGSLGLFWTLYTVRGAFGHFGTLFDNDAFGYFGRPKLFLPVLSTFRQPPVQNYFWPCTTKHWIYEISL